MELHAIKIAEQPPSRKRLPSTAKIWTEAAPPGLSDTSALKFLDRLVNTYITLDSGYYRKGNRIVWWGRMP